MSSRLFKVAISEWPFRRALALLMAAGFAASSRAEGVLDPEVGQAFREHWVRPRREDAKKLLGRAIEAGELRSDADLDTLLDGLFGPLYYRLLVNHAPLEPSFAEGIFRIVMAAVASPRSVVRKRSSASRSAATSE